jgi:ParB family transcriptional regulator, chromosome partitioning protein
MDSVMEKKARLGRGLDALIGNDNGHPPMQTEAPLDAIERNPYQPRKEFDDAELNALSASIRSHGVLQPLVVRQIGDRYQLVAGERRLRAAKAAGLSSVPVRIVDFNDQQVLEAALVENIQRTDLNPIEKAQGFKDYLDRFKMTHEQLAERLGLGRPTITNLVALLELPQDVQSMVRVGQLTAGHAKILKGVPDRDRQSQLAKEIIARGLSVHAAEAYIKQQAAAKLEAVPEPSGSEPRTPPEKTAHVQGVENELRQKLGLRVEIKVKGKDKGQIVLAFESNDDFERVLEVLRR